MNTSSTGQKPGLYTAIAVMTLTSGIVNLIWGFVASATALGTIIFSLCLPITILPTILGVFEIIYAANLLSNQPQPVKPSPSIAMFQISTIIYGNVFSSIVGLLNLIFFKDQAVAAYFDGLSKSAPSVPFIPTVTPEPLPTPMTPKLPEPPTVEKPAKPAKPRKVAGK